MSKQRRDGGDEGPQHADETSAPAIGPGKRSGTAGAPGGPPPKYPGKRSLTQHFAPREGRTPMATVDDVATNAVENKGSGSGLDSNVRSTMEAHLGIGLGDVRVHTDEQAGASANAMGARAFAHGKDVYLAPGEQPTDLSLMAHELTHVAQQAGGAAQPQRKVTVGAANSPAEQQADAVAQGVAGGERPPMLVEPGVPVQAGQLSVVEFLSALRTQVEAAAAVKFGPLWSVTGCHYIEKYFAHYQGRSAREIERAMKLYAPEAAASGNAQAAITGVTARVRAGMASWEATGQLPADAARIAPPEATQDATAANAPRGTAQAKPANPLAALGEGTPLDGSVASRMGDALGADVSSARVHTGSDAAQLARDHGATAVTVGQDIAFGAGAYQPGTAAGDALLAHELAHTVQQKGADPSGPVGDETAAAETNADGAAAGAVAQLHGGASKEAAAAMALSQIMSTGLQLQRCSPDNPRSGPTITDAFVLELQTKLAAGKKAEAFAALVGLNGSRAGDAAVRDGIKLFQTNGQLTIGEALRALVIVELGPDGSGATAWPVEVRNWVDGVNDGVFTVTLASVPAGRNALRELAVVTAGVLANGGGLRGEYQALFDGKWTIAADATDFDPTLDSKGPRNQRARRIFNELYREARFKTGYDTNTPAGFRDFCDTYAGPTSLNIVASPRLEAFRAAFAGAPIAAATTADAGYTAFVTTITPILATLDAGDHAVIESEPQRWQTLYEGKLRGSAADVIRDFLAVVSGASPAAPRARSPLSAPPPVVAPPAAPPAPGAPAPAPGAPAAPTAPEQAWLRSITIAGPASVDVEDRSTDVDFNIRSTTPNPSLVVEREVNITPAAQAMDGTDQSREVWAVGSSSQPHTATIDPTTVAAGGVTNVVAELTMPPHGAHFPAKRSAPVVVRDKRIDMVKRDVRPGLSFNEFDPFVNRATPALTYYGGQLTVRVDPRLPTANPGLNLFVSGEIKKGGAAVPGATFALTPFRQGTRFMRLGEVMLQQAAGGAAGAKDTFELAVRYQVGPAGAPFHSPAPIVFDVRHGTLNAGPTAADTALLAKDTTELNKPGAAAAPAGNGRSTVIEFLKFPPATLNAQQQANCRRVAAAVTSGTVPLKPMFVRSDSAAQVSAGGGDPGTEVAYALGSLAPVDILIERPGWSGWQAWRGPAIYINRTPDPLNPGATRPIEEMAMFAAHEAIHSVDDPPPGWHLPGASPDPFHRYRMEFRAYWVDGGQSHLSTDRDDSLTFGPKSPRANAIFQHIYTGYDYTKEAYDADDNNFRSKVDNYLYPDGINLIASAQLADLKAAVRNTAGTFAVRHARVSAAFAACTPTDRSEITGNRAWRDDVETNFTAAVAPVPGAAPPRTEPQRDQIKRMLGIPM